MKVLKSLTAEAWLTLGLLVLGIGGLALMPVLVAEPKALFGRALSAIPPSLFPGLVLASMALLAAGHLFTIRKRLTSAASQSFEEGALGRVVLLFAVMFFYALAMDPLGFFLSSALALAAISWISGNRAVLQIAAVSVIGPIALYLVATRGLAVALPELSAIEFLYARILN